MKSWYIVAGVLLVAGLPGRLAHEGKQTPQNKVPPMSTYRKWKKVNAQRVRFTRNPPEMCADPIEGWPSDHLEKFITVYVNDAGKPAMMSDKEKKECTLCPCATQQSYHLYLGG